MNSSKTQNERDTPFVNRLIRMPRILFEEEIVPILKTFNVPVPNSDFNVYKWVNLGDFVKNSSPAFRTKLTALCLTEAGIQINIVNQIPVITINDDMLDQTMELINSISRHNKAIVDHRRMKETITPKSFGGQVSISPNGVAIRDVRGIDDSPKHSSEDTKTIPTEKGEFKLDEDF
jgi:hypothetical protein